MKKTLALSAVLVALSTAAAQSTPGTIVAVAAGNPDFSTLVTAVQAAGLVDTLNGAGPFTVFAPTNAAFAKLPAATLQALLNDKAALTRVLTYHVVPGKVLAADVVKLTSAKSVEGSDIAISVSNNMVMLNGSSTVTATDVQASNGVIHVIDTVILPPNLVIAGTTPAAPAATATTPATPAATTPAATTPAQGDAVDAVLADPRFSTLAAAVQAAGLVETLKGAGPFTIFAPTNDAFAKLGQARIDRLLANKEELTRYLTYHVVAGKVLSSDIVGQNLRTAATVQGGNINIRVTNGNVTLNSRARVTQADIQVSNGVIHVIDTVLIPR